MNEEALGATLDRLRDAGRIEDVDAAWVEMLRSLARAVDTKPTSPGLWQQYREALEWLRRDDDDSETVEALFARLSAPVRDASED